MKPILLLFTLCCFQAVFAHQPALSSLMIYEQNGKYRLIVKSSLSAFDGEINFLYGKNAYKTPAEFQKLVIAHFQKNCSVVVNNTPIRLANPYVNLGHETTFWAELPNFPNSAETVFVKNTSFEDMPGNLCELILAIPKLPQYQYILHEGNNHAVELNLKNNSWTVAEHKQEVFISLAEFSGGILCLLIIAAVVWTFFSKPRPANSLMS